MKAARISKYGDAHPAAGRRWSTLDKVQDAFRAREAGHVKGKIVLKVRE